MSELEAQPAEEPIESLPPAEGTGIDPETWIKLPAPVFLGGIGGLIMAGENLDNSNAKVSLLNPADGKPVATCTVKFRRPEPGVEVGPWMYQCMFAAGHELFSKLAQHMQQSIAVPAKKKLIVPGA